MLTQDVVEACGSIWVPLLIRQIRRWEDCWRHNSPNVS